VVLAQHLFRLVTGDIAERLIDANDICIGIGDHDRLVRLEGCRRDAQFILPPTFAR